MGLKALALNGMLKTGKSPSSTDRMIAKLQDAFARHDVEIVEIIRLADHNILPGVLSDEGPGDGWPAIRQDHRRRYPDLCRADLDGPVGGRAMGSVDYKHLEHIPRTVSETAGMVAANAAHLTAV